MLTITPANICMLHMTAAHLMMRHDTETPLHCQMMGRKAAQCTTVQSLTP